MRVTVNEYKELITNKLNKSGLEREHATIVADLLAYADAREVYSHGAIRAEYYAERIAKGGINTNPNFELEEKGPSVAIYHGDNGVGHVAANNAMDEAIRMAKNTGLALVGVRKISHSGTLSYYVQKAADENLIGISMCQADPMAVPFGGAEPYYGTNPIAFAAPGEDGKAIIFDMATTEKAWGRILEARAKAEEIPGTWAVDKDGKPTTDPFDVSGLLPIAGAKGFGLGMMVDILAGVLLGLPSGSNVSALYGNLTEGRNLGQIHLVINPNYFQGIESFQAAIKQTMDNLNQIKPAPGFDKVYYPGQRSRMKAEKSKEAGIKIADDIYDYLVSDIVHTNKYSKQTPFGN
ncbi:ureidoglycolate dehydrogenase [Oceanobacillus longus]|uniref:Ureidoglycolate dehydrogenase n=1 Tax=Oceanobacillus longus TaxID=930120 RepID=A0ABV8H2T2_9BACI